MRLLFLQLTILYVTLFSLVVYGAELNTPVDVKTTEATLLDTTVFPAFINDTVPNVQGTIQSIYFDEITNAVYLTTTRNVIRVNLDVDASTAENYETFTISDIYLYGIKTFVPDIVNGRAILFGTPGGVTKYSFFNLTSFKPTDTTYPFPALSGDIIERFMISTTEFLIVSSNGFARFTITGPGVIEATAYNDNALNILSAEYTSDNQILYIGIDNSQILTFNISDQDLSNVNLMSTITLPTTEAQTTGVSVLFADTRAGEPRYLYATTTGNSEAPATCHRLSLSDPSNPSPDADYWVFTPIDYDISSGVFDPVAGIMLLFEQTTPGRIIQMDLSSFKWEITIELDDSEGPNRFTAGVIGNGYVYVGGTTFSTLEAQLNVYSMPDGCLSDCFGRGTCLNRYCTCFNTTTNRGNVLQYQQPWCEFRPCDNDCSGNALECSDGNCTCNSDYTGEICDIRRCPNDCTSSTNGVCDETTFECTCNPGFSDRDCSRTVPLPCEYLVTCDECMENLACGWCETLQTCHYGNPVTPYEIASCPSWHYGGCPAAIVIVAIILAVIMGLLLLVNLFSYAKQYSSSESLSIRDEWYSLQRSNKWWTALFVLQMVGASMFISVGYPTIMTSFLSYFVVLLFAPSLSFIIGERVPLNISSNATVLEPAAIYLGYSGLSFENLGLNVLLSWAIAAVGITVIFTILLSIITAVRGGEITPMITTRPIYVFLRILDFAVLPFALFGGLSLAYFDQAGIIGVLLLVAAVLYMIIVTVIFIISQVTKNIKPLFRPDYKGRCLFIYGDLKKDKFVFAFANVMKRLLLGFFIGVFYGLPIVQIISVVAVLVVFVILAWATDYNSDHYQKFTETGVAVVLVIATLLLLGFNSTVNGIVSDGTIATIFTVLYIVFICIGLGICFIFYFFNWFQKEEQFSFSQVMNVICCKEGDSDRDEE
eukprot:TRINITY_DN12763_c0_g1_i1.p1 TRINITY_DN12763_c0_g1~~TRINITY_DN12763_c0_g1_i1.p1  ORF type:complete len:938 (-),score=158.07 TRINITY_DN12763_c0_g1_i1:22-2835(-)